MKTHADKSQKNKIQSATCAVSQKQSNDESIFNFVDNRSEAITQRKLQELNNNSLRSKETAQLQTMLLEKNSPSTSKNLPLTTQKEHKANSSALPIQRKELNTGVLNVVGENHDRSDEVRTWESEYSREKTNGGYWEENEFKINKAKPDGEAEETVSVFGDPKILQMANAIQFNTKALSDITKFLSRIESVKATKFNLSLSRSKVFNNLKLVKLHLPKLKAFGVLHKKLKQEALVELADRPDLKDISDFYIAFGDEYYDVFVAGVEQWSANTSELSETEANETELNLAVTNGAVYAPVGKSLLTKMFEMEEVSSEEHDASLSAVILGRSKEMHKAGNIGKQSKGVWKVGNQHVADIKEDVLDGAQPEYELMTETEFNTDFDKWLAQNIDYQNMKKMEGGD